MRSRRSISGWLLGDTKAYGRRVTSKASFWPSWKEGQAAPTRRPQPSSRILTAGKGYSPKFAQTAFPEVRGVPGCQNAGDTRCMATLARIALSMVASAVKARTAIVPFG